MKRIFTSLLLLLFLQVTTQGQSLINSSGNATISNWTPAQNNNKFEPSIANMTVKYNFQPDSLQCKVQMSMQWYVGTSVHYNQEVFKYPLITSTEIRNFSIIDLEIEADVYSGSQYAGKIHFDMGRTPQTGGAWGDYQIAPRNWNNVLVGVSSYSAKNAFRTRVTLKNLKIKRISFGGEYQFKQVAYQKFVNQARQQENNKQWEAALESYQTAIRMIPNDNYARGKITELEQKLAKYKQFVQLGSDAYTKKEYMKALTAYRNAEKALPNQTTTQNRIKELEKRVTDYEVARRKAARTFSEAKGISDLLEAKKQYTTALTLLPVEKKTEIDADLKKINDLLESEHKHAMEEGKLAFDHHDYANAAAQYRQAMEIFPGRPTAKQKLTDCIRPLREQLKKEYKDKLAIAQSGQEQQLTLVAQRINKQNETCELRKYEEQICLERYYTAASKTIEKEVQQLIYANTSFKQVPMNCKTSTCQFDNRLETSNQTAAAYLLAAKRKHTYLTKYKNAAFQEYRDQYLDQSMTINPRNAQAFLFKAKISTSLTDQMLWYNRVLEIQPNNVEAKTAVGTLESKFMGELFTYVDQNRIDELQKALALGLLKKSNNYKGQNVIQYVIGKDNAPMLAVLLNQPNQLNPSMEAKPSPLLYYAVKKKAVNCVADLLSTRNADPNYQIKGQEPLLIQAVSAKSLDITKQLLLANANPYASNQQGKTALMIALETRQANMVEALLAKYEVSKIKNEEVFTAVRMGNVPIVQQFLEKGVDVNMKTTRGQALIHLAIVGQTTQMSQLILRQGADIEVRDREGNTALLLAAKQSKAQIAQGLVEKNARLEVKNNAGETTLYLSIKNNLQDLSAILLKRKANFQTVFALAEIRNEGAVTDQLAKAIGLMGIKENQASLVQTAMSYRPDLGYLPANQYPNLLREAAHQNRIDLFMMMIEKDPSRKIQASGLSALHIAISEKNLGLTQKLLQARINLKSETSEGLNPFHFAANTGFVAGIDVLTNHFNINMQDEQGNTALHHAVAGNQADMIRALINKGANPKIKNKRKWNPKKMAKKTKKKHLKGLF